MSSDTGQDIDDHYEALVNASLAASVEELRKAQINLLKAVMADMNTMGMSYQDEPWWAEFCALQKALP